MFFNILLLVLILTLSFWIYKRQVQYRRSRYLRQIFDSPPGIPIFGNALDFFNCRTMTEIIMGIDENIDDEIQTLTKMISKLDYFTTKRMIHSWLHPWLAFKLYLFAEGSLNIIEDNHNVYKKKVQEKRSMFNEAATSKKTNPNKRKPLIDMLLKTHNFNDHDLTEEVITLLYGGSDTTAAAISFTLLMLAQHPDVQEKVYQELYEIFGDDLRFPQAADLSKMEFLEQCIKETLRKYCVIPSMARKATEDIILSDGRIIPAGSCVVFLLHPLHHNPEFYPDPDTWNPQNFHPESVAKRPPNTFMPFIAGARMCIGNKYAMVSMKAFVSTFIRHFKISTSQREIILKAGIVTRSNNGYHIELTERQKNAEKKQE